MFLEKERGQKKKETNKQNQRTTQHHLGSVFISAKQTLSGHANELPVSTSEALGGSVDARTHAHNTNKHTRTSRENTRPRRSLGLRVSSSTRSDAEHLCDVSERARLCARAIRAAR